jgi:hypothetical protein
MKYAPFYCIMLVMLAIAALLVKALLSYVVFTLVRLKRLRTSADLSLHTLRENSAFFLGADVKGRASAAASMKEIFSREQENADLTKTASAFRRSLSLVVVSLVVAFVGITAANGQPLAIVLTGIFAFAVAIFGLFR